MFFLFFLFGWGFANLPVVSLYDFVAVTKSAKLVIG